jgi:hypothetical protein
MRKSSYLLIIAVFLSGCISTATKETRLQRKAGPCLENQDDLDTALTCLESQGYGSWYKDKYTVSSSSCSPYWGFPFVASCSGIQIQREGKKIKSYNLWAEYDAI